MPARRNRAARGSIALASPPNGIIMSKEGSLMARNRLRVYYGPEEELLDTTYPAQRQGTVTLQVADVLPLLADAVRQQRAWVDDFSDDEITVSTDLYEVLLAYQHFRRPGA
jgi:hypothetical protein